jgi:hypothetical protein
MEGMILLIFVDVRGQERRRRTRTAGCLFTGHVPRMRLSRLLVFSWTQQSKVFFAMFLVLCFLFAK